MANDGQVIIDVELSSDKVVKEAEQASKKIGNSFDKNVSKAVNDVEKNVGKISTAFGKIKVDNLAKEFAKIDTAVNKTTADIEKQKQKLEELKKAYDNTNDTKAQDKIQQQMKNTELSIERAEKQLDKLNSKKLKLDGIKDAANGLDGNFTSASMKATRALDNIEKKAEETGRTVKKSLGDINIGEGISKIGDKISSAGDTLTTKVTLPIVGIGVAAAKVGMDFDSSMSRVKAISGATGDEFKQLHDQALQLGADTAFSAKEAAQGMENLASAGFTVNEMTQAMPGLLDLAASSGESLASSSDIAASTLRGFGLEASQTGHVADVLAKNAGATNAAVADTGEAMKYISPVAHSMGLSLEEVTAAIGELANAGIKGSMAGTTLRSALTRLASPSDPAAQAMDSIGFSAFDAQGKLNSLSTIVGDLKESMKGLTDQEKQDKIATIFGQEAMSGMLTLIDNGSSALDDLTNSYKNADGAAKDMATTMQDNTKSAIEQMMGSVETAAIKLEEVAAPSITNIANEIQDLANEFADLSPETQQQVIDFALLAAAAGPVVKSIGMLTNGIGSLISIGGKLGSLLGLISTGAEGGAVALGGLSLASGVAVAAAAALVVGVAAYATAQYQMHEKVTTTTDDMTAWGKAINGMTGYTFKSKKELQDLGIEYKEFGDNISDDFKKKVEDATLAVNNFQLFLGKINLDGLIDSAESSDFDKQITKMIDDAINAISSKKSEMQQKMSEFFKNDDDSIDEKEQSIIDSMAKNYDSQISQENQLKEDIIKIKKAAVDEKRELYKSEIKDIQDKVNKIKEIELEAVGGTQEEKDYAKNEFGARVEKVNPEDAASLLQDKKKQLDEQNVKIKASYDTQLDMLKQHLKDEQEAIANASNDEEKQKSETDAQNTQAEIDKFSELKDKKLKMTQDEWQEYVNILKQKNPEALALIDEFNGEILTKEDKSAQDRLSKLSSTYAELGSVTESGTYTMKNAFSGSMDEVTVTVDEATGKIIGAFSTSTNAMGDTVVTYGGYTAQMEQDIQSLGQEHINLESTCKQAIGNLAGAHVNASGQIESASGQIVGSLEKIVTENGNVVSGIFNLNGTPIEIKTNADGTIANLQEVINKINAIPATKTVYIRTEQDTFDENRTHLNADGSVSSNYTGSNNPSEGLSNVDEHGYETAKKSNIKMLSPGLAYISSHAVGGDGINDHMTTVNEMHRDIEDVTNNKFGFAMSKFLNSLSYQTGVLNKISESSNKTADNSEEANKLNEKLANDLVNKVHDAPNTTFSVLQNEIDSANIAKEKADSMKIEGNSNYARTKQNLDDINAQLDELKDKQQEISDNQSIDAGKGEKEWNESLKKQLEIQQHELEKKKDVAEKEEKLAKEVAQSEIDQAKKAAEQQVKIAEEKKEKLTKLAEAVTTAIENELKAQKEAAEKTINDELASLEETYNSNITKIENNLKNKTDKIDEKIKALEEQSTEDSRDQERTDANNNINKLKTMMANTASAADKRSLQLQIEDAQKTLQEKENTWDIEDQKQALEDEKSLLEERADNRKKSLEEQYNQEKAEKEQELKDTDAYYDKLLESDSVNAQARYILLNGSQQDLVNLLNSYNPKWQDAGQSLADSLLTGLNSQKQSIQDAVDEMLSLKQEASSLSSSDNTYYDADSGQYKSLSGYASGTSYNPSSDYYLTNEQGWETSNNGDVAYVSKGTAIKNHMQSVADMRAEVTKQLSSQLSSIVSSLQSSIQASQADMQRMLVNTVNNTTNNSKQIQYDGSNQFHIENLNLNTGQDVEQFFNEAESIRTSKRRF